MSNNSRTSVSDDNSTSGAAGAMVAGRKRKEPNRHHSTGVAQGPNDGREFPPSKRRKLRDIIREYLVNCDVKTYNANDTDHVVRSSRAKKSPRSSQGRFDTDNSTLYDSRPLSSPYDPVTGESRSILEDGYDLEEPSSHIRDVASTAMLSEGDQEYMSSASTFQNSTQWRPTSSNSFSHRDPVIVDHSTYSRLDHDAPAIFMSSEGHYLVQANEGVMSLKTENPAVIYQNPVEPDRAGNEDGKQEDRLLTNNRSSHLDPETMTTETHFPQEVFTESAISELVVGNGHEEQSPNSDSYEDVYLASAHELEAGKIEETRNLSSLALPNRSRLSGLEHGANLVFTDDGSPAIREVQQEPQQEEDDWEQAQAGDCVSQKLKFPVMKFPEYGQGTEQSGPPASWCADIDRDIPTPRLLNSDVEDISAVINLYDPCQEQEEEDREEDQEEGGDEINNHLYPESGFVGFPDSQTQPQYTDIEQDIASPSLSNSDQHDIADGYYEDLDQEQEQDREEWGQSNLPPSRDFIGFSEPNPPVAEFLDVGEGDNQLKPLESFDYLSQSRYMEIEQEIPVLSLSNSKEESRTASVKMVDIEAPPWWYTEETGETDNLVEDANGYYTNEYQGDDEVDHISVHNAVLHPPRLNISPPLNVPPPSLNVSPPPSSNVPPQAENVQKVLLNTDLHNGCPTVSVYSPDADYEGDEEAGGNEGSYDEKDSMSMEYWDTNDELSGATWNSSPSTITEVFAPYPELPDHTHVSYSNDVGHEWGDSQAEASNDQHITTVYNAGPQPVETSTAQSFSISQSHSAQNFMSWSAPQDFVHSDPEHPGVFHDNIAVSEYDSIPGTSGRWFVGENDILGGVCEPGDEPSFMPSPSLPSPVAENHLIWNSPVPRPRYTGVSYNLNAEERCDDNPVWLDVNIGESDDHVEIVNNQPHLSSFPEGVHAWNAPPGNYADFDVVHGEPDNEPGDNEDWFTSQDEMSVDPGGTSYVAPLNVPLLSTAEIPVAYENLLHHAHDYALHSNDADFSLGWAENNCQSSDDRTRFFDPNAMLSADSRPSSNSGSDDPLPRPDVNPTNTRPSVTIEEIQEPEIYPNPLPYMGPDGPILRPTTAMGQHPNVEHAQDGCYQQNPNRYFDSDDHADLFHDTNNGSGDGNNHNNYESFNGDDDVQMDQGASGDGIEIDAENDTRPQQFDTANASYIRGLSPLTEIPDTPMPKTYSNEDEVLASLMGELSSLVQNGVKSLSMQSHFKSQMNDPNINIDTLEAILNRCYRYVGALSDNAAPSFARPEHDSNDQHLSADSEFSPKLYNPPTHRTEGKNYLAELVRNETGVLLGILGVDETRAEPLTPTGKFLATVSPGTIKDFANSRHDGPTVQNFVLQLHHGRRTAWNKAAAEVFCKHFRSQEGFGNYKKKDVYEAFIAHITQLKREFALQGRQKSTREKDDERRARRLARRHKLLHRRIKAFHQIYRYHPGPLGELAKFIRRLTPECMSGDETGMDRKYYKTQVEWRSQELADFLALLSAWYMGGRYLDHGKYSPGELPHPRYPSNRVDMVMQADAASLQLPINWYNPAWLTEYQERRNILSPLPAVSLELPGDITREAKRFLSVKGRSDHPLPKDHPLLN
ncbi:hypothetical protein EV368DRAFT_86088 [Lentinula lateritia]|nr:hypothetical protein EV368DRAFT_86088 [Lentinula lateritia]